MADNGKKKTVGERAFFWTKAMAVLVAAGLSVYAAVFRDMGEREARDAKDKGKAAFSIIEKKMSDLDKANTALVTRLERLTLRVVYLQAKQEESNHAKTYAELRLVQAELARLKGRQGRRGLREDLETIKAQLAADIKRRRAVDRRKKALMKGQRVLPRAKPMPSSPYRK